MQVSKKYKLRLGSYVMGAALILLGGIYFIGKNRDVFVKSFRLCAVFPDLGGLQIGDDVRLDGITIGTVDGVRILNDSSVMIFLLVEQQRQQFIKKNASAMISSAGMMGSKVLSIIPPSQASTALIRDGDTLVTTMPISVDDILVGIKSTAINTQLIAENFTYISKSMRGKKGMIGKLMNDKRFASNLDSAMSNFKNAKSKMNGTDEAASKEPEKEKKKFRLFRKKDKEEKEQTADSTRKAE